MSDKSCNLFDSCESAKAPLCPLQGSTVKHGIWYPDEPICQASQFQDLLWIKKQHQIAAFKLKFSAGFFTVKMLKSLHMVTADIKGADPDYPDGEDKWFVEKPVKVAQRKSKKIGGANPRRAQKPMSIPLFKDTDFLPPPQSKEKKKPDKKIVSKKPVKQNKKKSKTGNVKPVARVRKK